MANGSGVVNMRKYLEALKARGATPEQLDAEIDRIRKARIAASEEERGKPYTPGPVERFFGGGGRGLENIVSGTAQLASDVWAARKPSEWSRLFQQYVTAPSAAMAQKSAEAREAGDTVRADLYTEAASRPVIGPMVAGYAERFLTPPGGDYAGAFGETTAELLPLLLGQGGKWWSKLPEAEATITPFAIETSTSPMAGLANLLVKTPFFKGRAIDMVKGRNVPVVAEAQAIRQSLHPPIPPVQGAGGTPPPATALSEARGIAGITSKSAMELSEYLTAGLERKASGIRTALSDQWQTFVGKVGGSPVDVTRFRELAKQWSQLPAESQEFLEASMSPQIQRLLKTKGADLDKLFGAGATQAEKQALLEANPLLAGELSEPVSWAAIHDARKAVGRRLAQAKGASRFGRSPDYITLRSMYDELSKLLRGNLDEADLQAFNKLSAQEAKFHEVYGVGLADELVSGRTNPSTVADKLLSAPVEDVQAFLNALDDPVQQVIARQAMVNRMVESTTTLKGVFDRLLGKDAEKWKRVFPQNYNYLVSELGQRLQADLFESIIQGATGEAGIIKGPKLAQTITKQRERFVRYGMNQRHLNRLENFAKQLEPLKLSESLKISSALGTQFHAYLQMTMAGRIIAGAIGAVVGGKWAASLGGGAVGAAGMLIGERALVNMFLHPEGTSMFMRLVRSFKPGPKSAELVRDLGAIMSGGAIVEEMLQTPEPPKETP